MCERDIGQEILEGINEIKAFQAGNGSLMVTTLSEPASLSTTPLAKEIRRKLHLSQSAFAAFMGVCVRTIQDWEQGRRTPQGPAKVLLNLNTG